jgi:hypothetical protein
MDTRELLQLFENTCHRYCLNNRLRTLSFDFDDELMTTISFHVNVGFALFTDHGWKIGKNEPPQQDGKTDVDVMDALVLAIEAEAISINEIEKHIISIT